MELLTGMGKSQVHTVSGLTNGFKLWRFKEEKV